MEREGEERESEREREERNGERVGERRGRGGGGEGWRGRGNETGGEKQSLPFTQAALFVVSSII